MDKRLEEIKAFTCGGHADGYTEEAIEYLLSLIKAKDEALEEIKAWSKCYCRTEEEILVCGGGKPCPTCIADEALSLGHEETK